MILSLFLDTCYVKKSMLIGVIYRKPNGNIGSFLSKLEIVLNAIATSGKTCIIMGDFNINLLINSNRNTKTYTDLFTIYGYYPFINKPTRVSTHSATVIDHIWCNNTDMVTGGGILLCDISDHFATFFLLD